MFSTIYRMKYHSVACALSVCRFRRRALYVNHLLNSDIQSMEQNVQSTGKSLPRIARIREHKIGRLDRRNHSVMELLPELREIKVLVPILHLERGLHASLRRISIRVSREALHLIQVAQRSLIVIEQRGWRRALAGLSDLRKGLVDAELDEENAEGEDDSVGNEMLEVIRGRLLPGCWRGENGRGTRVP
jgi:hypothetical protein